MDFCHLRLSAPQHLSNEDFVLWGAAEGRGPAAAGKLQRGMMGRVQETRVSSEE